jgi:hypothetical protein
LLLRLVDFSRGKVGDFRISYSLLVELGLGPEEQLEGRGHLRLGVLGVFRFQDGSVKLAGNLKLAGDKILLLVGNFWYFLEHNVTFLIRSANSVITDAWSI